MAREYGAFTPTGKFVPGQFEARAPFMLQAAQNTLAASKAAADLRMARERMKMEGEQFGQTFGLQSRGQALAEEVARRQADQEATKAALEERKFGLASELGRGGLDVQRSTAASESGYRGVLAEAARGAEGRAARGEGLELQKIEKEIAQADLRIKAMTDELNSQPDAATRWLINTQLLEEQGERARLENEKLRRAQTFEEEDRAAAKQSTGAALAESKERMRGLEVERIKGMQDIRAREPLVERGPPTTPVEPAAVPQLTAALLTVKSQLSGSITGEGWVVSPEKLATLQAGVESVFRTLPPGSDSQQAAALLKTQEAVEALVEGSVPSFFRYPESSKVTALLSIAPVAPGRVAKYAAEVKARIEADQNRRRTEAREKIFAIIDAAAAKYAVAAKYAGAAAGGPQLSAQEIITRYRER